LDESREKFKKNKEAFKDVKVKTDASNGDVIKAFDVMWDSKYKMKRTRLDMRLEMKKVLTPEQSQKLRDYKKEHRQKMKEMHQKMKEAQPAQ